MFEKSYKRKKMSSSPEIEPERRELPFSPARLAGRLQRAVGQARPNLVLSSEISLIIDRSKFLGIDYFLFIRQIFITLKIIFRRYSYLSSLGHSIHIYVFILHIGNIFV